MPIPYLPQDSLTHAERLFLAGLRHPTTKPLARRAVRKATRLLALSLGGSLRDLRESDDPLRCAYAFGREQRSLARLFAEVAALLGARLDKLLERRRSHYSPHQRWRIRLLESTTT